MVQDMNAMVLPGTAETLPGAAGVTHVPDGVAVTWTGVLTSDPRVELTWKT